MAWTAPATWSTGQIVTATELNEQIRDNETYLKGQTDRLDSQSQTVLAGSTDRLSNTTYQNTTGKYMLVITRANTPNGLGNSVGLTAYCNSSSPLTSVIAESTAYSTNSTGPEVCITFPVPVSWYYKVTMSGTGAAWPGGSGWVETIL